MCQLDNWEEYGIISSNARQNVHQPVNLTNFCQILTSTLWVKILSCWNKTSDRKDLVFAKLILWNKVNQIAENVFKKIFKWLLQEVKC